MRTTVKEIKTSYNCFDTSIVLSGFLCYNGKNSFNEVTYGGEL